jgi:hypothetical protein
MAKNNKTTSAPPAAEQTTPPPAPPETPKADAGAAKLSPIDVELKLPMVRVTGADGSPVYAQRRIDVALTAQEAQALRDLFDGLSARGLVTGTRGGQAEALRYLLQKLGTQFALQSPVKPG